LYLNTLVIETLGVATLGIEYLFFEANGERKNSQAVSPCRQVSNDQGSARGW
jgi:hypothetical protein